MLAALGEKKHFAFWVHFISKNWTDFDVDKNVSVFETNIRVLGGLLSSHMFAEQLEIENYNGALLSLAVDLGDRLLKAFTGSNMFKNIK
jgi:hypothetical protein